MKKMIFLALMGLSLSLTGNATVTKKIGNVVIVEKSFGAPNLDECKSEFKSVSLFYYVCEIQKSTLTPYDQILKGTSKTVSSLDKNCSLSTTSTVSGYLISITLPINDPFNPIPPNETALRQTAIECLDQLFVVSHLDQLEMKSTIQTIE